MKCYFITIYVRIFEIDIIQFWERHYVTNVPRNFRAAEVNHGQVRRRL